MRKLSSLILAIIMVFSLMPFGVLADDTEIVASGTCSKQYNSDMHWTLDSSGLLTITGYGDMDSYGGQFGSAPWGTEIKSVAIGEGIRTIGSYAFADCAELTSAVLPESLVWAGSYAFYNCKSLNNIKLPNSFEFVGEGTFSGCSSLEYIAIPDGATELRDEAFNNCTGLSDIYLPNSLESIGHRAFGNCRSLKNIVLPPKVTWLGVSAFSGCTSLENITLPRALSWLREYTFSRCKSLNSITIGKALKDTEVFLFGYNDSVPYPVGYPVDIYYEGSENDWLNVTHRQENFSLARVHYNNTGTNHTYTNTAVSPTCSTPGRIEHNCTCGVSYTEYPAELGHNFVDGTCTRCGASSSAEAFTDFSSDDFYSDAVNWAVGNGITLGTSNTTFSPDEVCTRAQIVTFLWRLAGRPVYKMMPQLFTDVSPNAYCYNAVQWAAVNNITTGTGSNCFSPEDTCTRAQIVTFLMRIKTPFYSGVTPSFVDVQLSDYYFNSVEWAVEYGITNGVDTTHFAPEAGCTRAQVVTFLYRAKSTDAI